MKMVAQVVNKASVIVNKTIISKINKGLIVYFCVESGDDETWIDFFAKKIASLRIFADENGKTNLSVRDINGEVLLVSQFTLAGDFYHGNRPSFSNAEEPKKAKKLYEMLAAKIEKEYGVSVKLGAFGEDMIVEQTGAGPFTAYIEKH